MGSSSTEKLVSALKQAGAPDSLVAQAQADAFHDFRSESATPKVDLVRSCQSHGLHEIAKRAMKGDFDSSREEADEWLNSPEGKEIVRKLGVDLWLSA